MARRRPVVSAGRFLAWLLGQPAGRTDGEATPWRRQRRRLRSGRVGPGRPALPHSVATQPRLVN